MTAALARGFADPVFDTQAVFRALLEATARPGAVQPLPATLAPPAPLAPGLAAVALALADQDAPLWLDPTLAAAEDITAFLRFHTGAPIVSEPRNAAFALVAEPAKLPPLSAFAVGTPEYPDRSTTVVLAVERLAAGPGLTLAGPGIDGVASLDVAPLSESFRREREANHALFPRGVDLILVADASIAALPRTTRIVEGH